MSRPWSFSSLNMYRTCPRQYELTKVKNVIPYTETEATKWGSEVHLALENYAKDSTPLGENFVRYKPWVDKILSMPGEKFFEREFALTRNLTPTGFEDDNAWCRGIIDVGVIDGSRAATFDYKTGKVRPDSDQLKLFALFVFYHYPEVDTVKTAYLWLAHNKTTVETYHRKHIPALLSHFMTHSAKLEQSYTRNKWPPKPSGLCNGWCGAGKAHCEFWSPRIKTL